MRQPTPHGALQRLDVLVGAWEMWAAGRSVGPVRTEFAWLEGGAFLVQHADIGPDTVLPSEEWVANAPFPTVALTGYDDAAPAPGASEGMRYAYVHDPEGNLIELIETERVD